MMVSRQQFNDREITPLQFRALVLENPFNEELLGRLASMGLSECHLTAGCLFQTVWNQISGRDPAWGIKDYDIFYFDDQGLSWDAEDRVIRWVAEETADMPIKVEIKNQARVHLWYRERFGGHYPHLKSARAGIDHYLISCTCIGINAQTGQLYAPYGFHELISGKLAMNPLNPRPELFRQKAVSYQQRWPWLQIVE